jgi:hypothetical protein
MGVQFGGSSYIDFGDLLIVSGIDNITAIIWMVVDGINSTNTLTTKTTGWLFEIRNNATANHLYVKDFRGITNGEWRTAANTITTGGLLQVAFSLQNRILEFNDAVIHINGVSKAVTKIATPAGGPTLTHDGSFYISGPTGLNGKILDAKIYNRVLSTSEILDDYNARCKILNDNGLVFHALLDGCDGVSTFDGMGTHSFVDRINGASGASTNFPLGYADPYLATCAY